MLFVQFQKDIQNYFFAIDMPGQAGRLEQDSGEKNIMKQS
jgi:hypothetical protein